MKKKSTAQFPPVHSDAVSRVHTDLIKLSIGGTIEQKACEIGRAHV